MIIKKFNYYFFDITDSINIEDDVMWNQAVQTIEKTIVIIQTVSSILRKFSFSVICIFIYFFTYLFIFYYTFYQIILYYFHL